MRIYSRKIKGLIIASVTVAILAVFAACLSFYDFTPLPDDGQLKLLGGEKVLASKNGYQLDLGAFTQVGETQVCVFVFRNENSATSHTSVNIDWNRDCFDVNYEPTFSIGSNQEFEYRVSITLTDYPSEDEDMSFSLGFQTDFYG